MEVQNGSANLPRTSFSLAILRPLCVFGRESHGHGGSGLGEISHLPNSAKIVKGDPGGIGEGDPSVRKTCSG